jgi:acyl-homoserine lactone acylase PvdQ
MATLEKFREFLTSALPDVTSDIDLEGLDGSIQIHRDTYGIPHVRAESVHDAFFGQGFVTAQDRLWHIDTDRRKGYGRWAEFAGKSGVEQDLMMRRFQIGPTVERDYRAVHAHTRAMLDAYAEGVNAFINSTNTLPIEYSLVGGKPEFWRPSDCLAVFKARHIMMGVFEGKLWRAKLIKTLGVEKAAGILRGYQPGHLTIVPPEKEIIAKIVPGDLYVAQAQKRIAEWDGSMERNAIAPTIYSAFRTKLQARLIGHLLGPLAEEVLSATGPGAPRHVQQLTSLLVTMARDGDTSYLPLGEDWVSVVSQALDEGVSDLRQKLGEDMDLWRWGTVHHTQPRHTLSDSIPGMAELLDPPSVPMGGDGDTPQAGSYSAANPYTMMSMLVARYVFDAGDWDNSRWIVPLGSSGHPGSLHYADQTPIWAEIDLIPMLYDWGTIKRESESQQTLHPR